MYAYDIAYVINSSSSFVSELEINVLLWHLPNLIIWSIEHLS